EGEIESNIVPSTGNVSTSSGAMDCSYETRDVTQFVSELPAWSNYYATLQPGVLIGTRELENGVISILPVGERNVPMYISASIPSPNIIVENANSSSIKAAINELQQRIVDSNSPLAATISFRSEVISSDSEFQDKFGMTAGIASKAFENTGSIKMEFGSSSSGSGETKQKNLVIKLVQPMYTISISHDQFLSSDQFFGKVTEGLWHDYDSGKWFDSENPPVFISDVTYGRMIIFNVHVDSSMSNTQIQENFGLKFGNGNSDGSLSMGGNSAFAQALEQNRVEVLAIGGSDADALEALKTGDFSPFFNQQDPRTALPLNYTARHIVGSREVVAIRSTLSYTAADCYQCTKALAMDEFSITTPRFSSGAQNATLISGCSRQLNTQFLSSCGVNATRKSIDFIENRLGMCNVAWTTNNQNDCSVNISGEDRRKQSGGTCEVVCQLSIIAEKPKPNQPPMCKH
ncbi:MAG: thiol-activated cytolysin family protein, partial [Gammaproteobacteria bacterium]|nr:thiol-activated cytolysin family protein [Gammaproteobacteria bacterium]